MLIFLLEHHSLYSLFKLHWFLFAGILIYYYVTKLLRSSFYSITKKQQLYFVLSLLIVLVLKATPFDVIATHYLFSMHVLQVSFIFFIAIPLFLLSVPATMFRQIIWNHRTKLLFNVLSYPWLTLITFNGLLTIYLIPAIFNLVHGNLVASIIAQLILTITAISMWWVIIHPLPEVKGLSYLVRALYIFLASLALFPIGFFYVIIQKAHFPVYANVEQVLIPVLTSIYDQQLAGGILKITQLASYSVALFVILFTWSRLEEAREGDVDEEHIRYARGVVIHLDKDDS